MSESERYLSADLRLQRQRYEEAARKRDELREAWDVERERAESYKDECNTLAERVMKAEWERDEWKRKAQELERLASQRKDEQDFNSLVLQETANILATELERAERERAERERDELRKALHQVTQTTHGPKCVEIARRALGQE